MVRDQTKKRKGLMSFAMMDSITFNEIGRKRTYLNLRGFLGTLLDYWRNVDSLPSKWEAAQDSS